ncbi:unnamed protein product [Zymoseptoria tritici ST99CH_1A5]|uniref:Beach-domain-containing protein n=1 Tax=Zymoseptoria tritici ST99CH_1A5 TaxID=1276529 RepID=A0A1Y6LEN7_ZYMTR|nr:unnamed protein product [Zymoseptoria tritici ST99CH_1A5]
MAMRVALPTRHRRNSKGLSPDEQASTTAGYIRRFSLHHGPSVEDELSRLSDIAQKLQQELASHSASQDTFRRGHGFERVLEILRADDLRNDTWSYEEVIGLISSILQLLSEALHDSGNERYFHRVDGWGALEESLEQIHQVRNEDQKRSSASLYDALIAFALGRVHFDLANAQTGCIVYPNGCATALRLALRVVERYSGADEANVASAVRVIEFMTTLTKDDTRCLIALWNTSILSDVLRIAPTSALPTSAVGSLQDLTLALGRFGLNELDDVSLVFQRASEDGAGRDTLLRLMRDSKQPAFIQFDLQPRGFSSIEVPSIRNFPPQTGYSISAWIRIDKYDSKSHTTLFGAYDVPKTCFILMYLEKDSHQLILQTSVNAPNPSVRFKSTQFKSSQWYHMTLVQRRNPSNPSQSVASLFVDGVFAEQRKCNYPDVAGVVHEKQRSQSAPPRPTPIQGFFGTPRSVAMDPVPNAVHTRWSLANAHVYHVPLTDEFVAVSFRLGPRYRGNLQDCLGSLLTYRASAELNKYNETLHPEKNDKSDIIAATEGRGSEVVSESRLILAIDPSAVIEFAAAEDRNRANGAKHELDRKAMSKYQQLTQHARVIAINTAVPGLNEAIGRSFGTGLMFGDPAVIVPQPLDDATWRFYGAVPVLLQQLETANSKKTFLQSVEIFFESVQDSWRVSEAMEKGHGFSLLAVLIREKLGLEVGSGPQLSTRRPATMLSLEDRQSLPLELLELVLRFVGYDKSRPDESLLINPIAYRILVVDFDTWRRSDMETQTLYWTQFTAFITGNRNFAFNQKRFIRMRIIKRLVEALKAEDISEQSAKLMMVALKTLLGPGSSHGFYRDLAMFVAYALHDDRAMPIAPTRTLSRAVSRRSRVGSVTKSARSPRPTTPGGGPQQVKAVLPKYELGVLVLRLLADVLNEDRTVITVRRFSRALPSRWLLHLLAENDVRIIEITLSIICKSMSVLGSEFKSSFIDRTGGFVTLKSRLKPFWRSKVVWSLAFATLFGRSIPLEWLEEEFSAFHLVEMLSVDKDLAIANPEMLPAIFAMLEAGLRKVAQEDEPIESETKIIKNAIQFLNELYDRSPAFADFAVNSRYLQEVLFILYPLLAGTDRLSAETELQSEALSFKGEEVKMRPHSNSLGERPPSVRSLKMNEGRRTPSPMAPNRVEMPRRMSSFVMVNDTGERLTVPRQFSAPMAPKATQPPVKINVANSLVESLLELVITLFIDQVCEKDKFNGIGLFLRVPPGFREHQAYFESYILVNALSQLGSHFRLHQRLLTETKVLTNLARYTQHMAEAVSEGWFIDGAQPLLEFTGETLDHLQRPEIATLKSVRLCSQSTNAIRVVFLKATLWRLAELNEDADEKEVGDFLAKMTYWQTILFSPENQETLFTKLICFLLYHKLVSEVKTVRLAAAQLWRIVLVQKPTETATMLTNTMGPEQRHLSTGFMKLISMDDDDFLGWIDENRPILDSVFHHSLSKPWEDFVNSENRNSEETTKSRISKRREKLRQWHAEETAADDMINRYEVTTNHWRSNVHAQERLKLQRAIQDHQENVSLLYREFDKLERLARQPCGLKPSTEPARWQLDETEAANRMRMRVVADTSELKEAFLPKRKSSRRLTNGRLAINTQIARLAAEESGNTPVSADPTPDTPPGTTDGSTEFPSRERAGSDAVSNSQLLEGGFEMVDDPREDEDGLIEDKNRKVMTNLQRGDMVQQLHNISRIVGLEACEGLLVVGQKCLYMQDNFFQRSDGEIVSVSQAPEDERDPYVQLISGKDVGAARSRHSVGDQETRNWTWSEVLSISKRRFLLRDVAIEVFFTDGRSYLLTCMSSKSRDDLYNAIVYRAPHVHSASAVASEDAWRLDTLRTPEDVPKNFGSKFGNLFNAGPTHAATKRWQRGEMSNFQYLMLVNTMAGRTFNDLTQYPIFPWVLADYTSEELNLDNPKTFRNFSKPMGCQTPTREAEYKDRFKQFAEMGDHNAPPFHYGTHYSSAMIVSSYLIRLQPFVQSYLLLQGGSFDHADRLFDSIERAWQSASRDNMTDVRELTPEFFYLPEFLTNVNGYEFGSKQVSGEAVNNVHLPKWAKGDPHIFINKHREALESEYVSQHLHEWIDLVFGYKQRGEAAVEATNVFQHLSYGGAKDLDKIDDHVERLASIGIIHSFGQTPNQVFLKGHPYREADRDVEPKLDVLAETLTRLPDTTYDIHERVADLNFISSGVQSADDRLLATGPCKLNLLPDCTRYMQWGFPDNSIRFFSKRTNRLLGLYENTHVGPITTATFVDSKTLITGGEDCTIGVWKVAASRDSIDLIPRTHLFGHRTPITVLAASRVFSTLLSVSADGQVLLWGLNRQDCIRILLPAGGPPVQAARISNVSGHILLCRGSYALLYTLNGHLLVSQRLCEREDEEILCAAFYEGAGNEYLARELIFTGHSHGITNVWNLTNLSDGTWYLQLVKRMQYVESEMRVMRVPAGITSVLPVAKAVYTGDEEGNVWQWECVVRGSSFSGRGR